MMFLVFWSFNENISLGKKENKKKNITPLEAMVTSPAGVVGGSFEDVSGMLHRESRPAESPWIRSLWNGSRRPKKKRVTGGQISSCREKKENVQ